jgi:hypothetical protein
MKAQACPYLGLKDDSGTTFSYASAANHCFRVTPVVSVKLDHQHEFCLSSHHHRCELFRGGPGKSRVHRKVIARRSRRVRRWISNQLVFIFPTLIILVSIIGLTLFKPPEGSGSSTETSTTIPPSATIENTRTTIPKRPTPSRTSTKVVTTPTMMDVHGLEVPIGTLTPLVIHRVGVEDSLMNMAKNYNTTEEAITSLNYNLSLPLWPDLVIVIPLNQVDVTNLPQFEPYQVTESLSLQALADRFACDIELLRFYNLVDQEYIFKIGEWVLIPHLKLATPIG